MSNSQAYGNNKYGKPVRYGLDFAPNPPTNLRSVLVTNSLRPTFWWDSAIDHENDPVTYEFQLSADSDFENIAYEIINIPDRPRSTVEFIPDEDLPLSYGTYFWRVRATDAVGSSVWSNTKYVSSFSYQINEFVITLTHYETPSPAASQHIYGTIAEPNAKLRINGQVVGDVIPSRNWAYDIPLSIGRNEIVIDAISQSGKLSNQISITIDYAYYIPQKHHIWNHWDEFGLMLDLPRIVVDNYFERNWNYQARLFDVMTNPPSSSHQGLVNAISRELNLTTYNIDKNTLFRLDKRPDIKRIFSVKVNGEFLSSLNYQVIADAQCLYIDPPVDPRSVVLINYFDTDGNPVRQIIQNLVNQDPILLKPDDPTLNQIKAIPLHHPIYKQRLLDRTDSAGHGIGTKLEHFVNLIVQRAPMTWDSIIWDESYFDAIPDNKLGYSTLPIVWDAKTSTVAMSDWQPGIGDQDDLYISKVVEINGL